MTSPKGPSTAVRPVFPYYGGKARLAPKIVAMMPPHRLYVEPYGGSAAVLLAKPPSKHEVLNDLDGNVVAFYRAARDQPEELQRALTLTPYSRDEYQAAAGHTDDLDDVERARRFVVRCSQSVNAAGAAGAPGWALSTTRNQSRGGTFAGANERIWQVAERLRRVYIENTDAVALVQRFGRYEDAVIYLDPPYLASTRVAVNGAAYRLDANDNEHHSRLLEAIWGAQATVLLSGHASRLYSDHLTGWTVTALPTSKPSANRSGSPKVDAAEIIYSNRPLPSDAVVA
jgi:DNA adenine methylase